MGKAESILSEVVDEKRGSKYPTKKLKEIRRRCEGKKPDHNELAQQLKSIYNNLENDRKNRISDGDFGDIGKVMNGIKNDNFERLEKDIEELQETLPQADFDALEEAIADKDWQKVKEEVETIITACLEKGEDFEDLEDIAGRIRSTKELDEIDVEIDMVKKLNETLNRDSKEYIALVNIPHINYHPDEELEIGTHTLIPAQNRSYEEHYEHYFEDSPPMGKWEIEAILGNEDPTLEIRIDAYDSKQAQRKMKEEMSRFLDMCSHRNPEKDVKDLPLPNAQLKTYIFPVDMEGPISSPKSQDANMKGYIDSEDAQGIKALNEAMSYDTELSDRFERGIHFFRKSNNMDKPIDQCIFLIASLEALVIQDGQSKNGENIDDVLDLAQIGGDREKEVRASLENLYEARNDSLHSGIKKENLEADIHTSKTFLANLVIVPMINRIKDDGIETLDEFEDEMEVIKDRRHTKAKSTIEDADGVSVGETTKITGELKLESGDKVADVEAEIGFIDEGETIHQTLKITGVENKQGRVVGNERYQLKTDISEDYSIELKYIEFRVSILGVGIVEDLPVEATSFGYEIIEK